MIDVVVPVYERYELTRSCLEHLSNQSADHRVIVVDDGSRDDSPAQLRREWPRVTLLELAQNGGYTGAVNHGVEAGEGEYVVLLNNDVELRPDCLERLVAPLRRDPGVGSVASLMLAPGEHAIDSFGVSADITLAGFARLQGRPPDLAIELTGAGTNQTAPSGDPSNGVPAGGSRLNGAPHDAQPEESARRAGAPVLAGPEGTAGAYRRAAWEQVGGLDEGIDAYMEILDLALRLRSAGWTTAQAPDAVGVHLGSVTYGSRSPTQRRLAGYSRGYLLRRYGVLRGRAAPRTLLTEALVVAGDAVLCRDLEALRGRLDGWRAARGRERRPWPPPEAIDYSISLRESLALRRGAIS
ncbi:MAG TPA: glycosyltransferase family 2 protein [Solirubrobacteraceae bacterium]|nr:glycosyltransferase family 2 protein [Solirubrobacteraceae bacterium]